MAPHDVAPGRFSRRARRPRGVLAAALLLAVPACSSDGEGRLRLRPGCRHGRWDTRTVTDSEGNEVGVPADTQTIVTLHFAAVQALLEPGAEPTGQYGTASRSLPTEE